MEVEDTLSVASSPPLRMSIIEAPKPIVAAKRLALLPTLLHRIAIGVVYVNF